MAYQASSPSRLLMNGAESRTWLGLMTVGSEDWVTGRVVSGRASASAARWRLDSSAGTELCDPQQVVSGADQVGGETGSLDAPIARAPEVADRLDPAEDLFDPLAHSLAHRVSRPIGGAMVECRASGPPLVLRYMGSDIERAAVRHESRRVVALVAGHRDPARPANLLEHLQPLLAFGPAAGLTHAQIDHY